MTVFYTFVTGYLRIKFQIFKVCLASLIYYSTQDPAGRRTSASLLSSQLWMRQVRLARRRRAQSKFVQFRGVFSAIRAHACPPGTCMKLIICITPEGSTTHASAKHKITHNKSQLTVHWGDLLGAMEKQKTHETKC